MTPDSESTFCYVCGSKSPHGASFCHKCGQKLLEVDTSLDVTDVDSVEKPSAREEFLSKTVSVNKNAGNFMNQTPRNFIIFILIFLVLAGAVIYVSQNHKSDPNTQGAYASNPNQDGSIASLISQACSDWADLKNGPDMSIGGKTDRDTDYEYRKNVTSDSFDRLWLISQLASNSTVYQYLSDSLMNIGVDATLVDTSTFTDIETFCNSSSEEQIRPYLESPGVHNSQITTSDSGGNNQAKNLTPPPETPQVKPTGHWEMKCESVEYPNPNYDPYKGFSAIVNEPTITTQKCSQVWVAN